MSDYISRADAVKALTEYYDYSERMCIEIKALIEDIPSADAVEVDRTNEWVAVRREEYEDLIANAVQGEWIEVEDYNGDVHYKCDQCGEEWTFPFGTPKENNANFCPNCGARMKGGAE